MDDLSSLLLAAIEETERLAKIAKKDTEGIWGPSTWNTAAAAIALYDKSGRLAVGSVSHIERHDPSSVLRRCAADKRTVELHRNNGGFCSRCYTGSYDEDGSGGYPYTVIQFERYPCATLRNTAEGYGLTDHQEGETA